MTKRQKRVRKFFQNPRAVSFKELDQVLRSSGFEVRQPGGGSSHYVYTKAEVQISVPLRRPFVKEVYVKRVLELIGEENEEKS